ncbi:hypothetical protein [Oceanivirga miroungae]|uniref:Uncharacterized protein n=1 Tax=Oceanivirga miroungae TaxID=1130046 RepID=A0A6I8M8J1_9FUSO|nr:hypothetical protein [Oceanivirga miroungae]VWL85834.1 hypothetical protein OMES3154_01121 [Oceanivirga miroungae]
MEFYKSLVIKILDRSLVGSDSHLLKKLKKNIDLTQDERRELEELLENIL